LRSCHCVPSHAVGVYGPKIAAGGVAGAAKKMICGGGNANPELKTCAAVSWHTLSPLKKLKEPLVPSAPNEFSMSL
jgi:hypothetical protein